MISLKELQNRKSVTVKDWTTQGHIKKGIQFIMTDVNVLTSVVLYNLLFRLEGIFTGNDKVPEINLIDRGIKVTEKDIIIGNFIQADVGKNMIDALIDRYQGVFTTSIYKVQESDDFLQSLINDKDNKIVIGLGKNTENSNGVFNELIKEKDIIISNFKPVEVDKNMIEYLIDRYQGVFTTSIYKVQESDDFLQSLINDKDNKIVIGLGKNTENSNRVFNELIKERIKERDFGGVLQIHGMSKGDEVSVYTNVLTKQNSILGERNIKGEKTEKKKAEQIIMENQIIANTVIMLMNTMITDDESIKGNPYKKWTQNILTGETHSKYHEKGSTIFHERGYMGNFILWNVKDEVINSYSDKFKKYVKETKFEGDREELLKVSGVWEKLISRKIIKDNKKKLMIYEREELEKMMALITLKRLAVSDKEKYTVLKMLEDNLRMSELV